MYLVLKIKNGRCKLYMDDLLTVVRFFDFGMIFDIAAIITTIIVAKKTLSKPKLLYDIKCTTLIWGCRHFRQLEVKYQSREIEQLSSTTITIWNNGNKTLEENDIPKATPLRISTKDDVEILGYRISDINNKANKVTLTTFEEENRQSLKIDFSYLDPNDGFKVEILHTGRSSSDIKISGRIKGKGKIENHQASGIVKKALYKIVNNDFVKKLKKITKPYDLLYGFKYMTFLLVILVLLYSLYSKIANLNNDFDNTYSVILFGVYAIIYYGGVIHDKIPKSLK